MTKALFFTLPLLAACALAESPGLESEPQPIPVEEGAEAVVVVSADDSNPEDSYEAYLGRKFHEPLHAILLFVFDKASADAAAPRVKDLLMAEEGKELRLTDYEELYLYHSFDCFGSTALKEVLTPLLFYKDSPALQQFRKNFLPLLDGMFDQMAALADELEAVTDEASAARAAAALRAYPEACKEYTTQLDKAFRELRPGMATQYVMAAIIQGYPRATADRFVHAYAHAQGRVEGGFPEQEKALTELMEGGNARFAVILEELTPENAATNEKLVAALGEWLRVAATIHDKASADAAADWLTQRDAEQGMPLLATWEYARRGLLCPCFSSMDMLMQNLRAYFAYASPAWFGSEKLEALHKAYLPTAETLPPGETAEASNSTPTAP